MPLTRWPSRARALGPIALALIACNLAAMLGAWLPDAERAARSGEPGPVVRLLLHLFHHPAHPRIYEPDFPRNWLTRAWVHWDAVWYALIAKDGYWYVPGQQSPVAYFPLYPLTVRGLMALGVNRYLGAILLTMASGCLGLWLFHLWSTRLVGERTALRATILFALYPFAFYLFGVMYSSAFYLCLAVAAFYALERDRLWTATLLGALACATRPIAPALVLGMVARRIELRLRSGEKVEVNDIVPALAGTGAAAFMLFQWVRFGDPLAFAHVQAAPGWENLTGWHSISKIEVWQGLADDWLDSGNQIRFLHGLVALLGLSLAVPIWRRLSKAYALYVAVAIGMPLVSSRDFMGLGRYCMAAFPVFVMLALLLEERPRLRWAYAILSALLLLFFSIAFGADNYVA